MSMFRLVLVCLLFIFLAQCTSADKRDEKTKFNRRYLTMIDTMEVYNPSNDSLYFESKRALSPVTVVNYIDGSCMTCVEDLIYWKKIIDTLDNKSLDFRFYFYAENFSFIKNNIRRWRFSSPMYLDKVNTFYTANELRPEKETHSFVVNDRGEILYDKNPLYDSTAFNYYLTTFSRTEHID